MSLEFGLDNPQPEVTARLTGRARPTPSISLRTWQIEDVLAELLSRADGEGSGEDDESGHTLQVVGAFGGSPPGLTLDATRVRNLVDVGVALEVRLTPLNIELVRRQAAATQKQTNETSMAISFRVRGDFDPSDFTQRVGVAPTHVTQKDDQRRTVPAQASTWRLELGPYPVPSLSRDVIDKLLTMLRTRSTDIRTAVRDLKVRSAFRISATYIDLPPFLRLERSHIREISELGAILEYSVSAPRESSDYLEF